MRPSLFLTLFSLILCSTLTRADEPCPPLSPAAGIDATLMGAATPQAFFADRKTNTACREELAKRRATYFTEREGLEKMLGGTNLKAIDNQSLTMEAARDSWIEQVALCGNCASQEVQVCTTDPTAGQQSQVWYTADASCYVEGLTASGQEASFKAKTDSLHTQKAYPSNSGGFPTVFDFYFVDNKTGQKLNTPSAAFDSPFYGFIAIRGPLLFGLQVAFGYFYKNQGIFAENNGMREYINTFETEKAPRGFQFPSTVTQHLASGRTREASLMKLTRVRGLWYLTADGYLRYHTAADFGMNLEFAKKFAQNTLLTALATLYERGVGEAP